MNRSPKKLMYVCALLVLSPILFMGGCFFSNAQASIDINKVLDKKNVMPLVIIGSGPAGLSALIYALWGNVKTVMIRGPLPGGLITQTSLVENWPGFKSKMGEDIIADFETHVAMLQEKFLKSDSLIPPVQFLEDTVENIDVSQWPYQIKTKKGSVINALSIIMATGANPKKLGIPGEHEYEKRGVTWCAVCDAPAYTGKDVVVIGGGDSAIEEAVYLTRYANSVTILVRKEKFRASPTMQSRLSEYPTIKIMHNVEPKKILGDDNSVTGIEIYNNTTQEQSTLNVQGVFVAIGHNPSSEIVRDFLKTDNEGYIILTHEDGRAQTTSMPGIFAAGDVADRIYRQAGTAEGQGIQAMLDAGHFLTSIGLSPALSKELEKNMFLTKKQSPLAAMAHGTADGKMIVVNSTPEFETEVLAEKGFVFVDFMGTHCKPCAMLEPIVYKLSEKYASRMKFVKVNTDNAYEVADKLYIKTVPNIMVYKDGAMIARYNAAMDEDKLALFIDRILEEAKPLNEILEADKN